jgi:lipid-A-disaccharide synthase
MPGSEKILIVAGEASADMHAGALVDWLCQMRPGIQVFGVGGAELARAGARIIHDFSRIGVVGIAEILPALGKFYQVHKDLVRLAKEERPDLVLLLDLPDFNLYLAGKIKSWNPSQRIVYYISPQVWAWRQARVKKIKQRIDKMLVIFPFEKEFYEREGVPVEFVGHPLSDRVKAKAARQELQKGFGMEGASRVIALLPGSRREENRLYVPAMKGAVQRFLEHDPGIRFLVAVAGTVSLEGIAQWFEEFGDRVKLVQGATYDVIAASDFAIVASGTATLETALMGIPMIILVKTSMLNYYLARPLVKVNRFGLPNLIAGRDIVPELFMGMVNSENIFREAIKIVEDSVGYERMKRDLEEVRRLVTVDNASKAAAEAVIRFMDKGR